MSGSQEEAYIAYELKRQEESKQIWAVCPDFYDRDMLTSAAEGKREGGLIEKAMLYDKLKFPPANEHKWKVSDEWRQHKTVTSDPLEVFKGDQIPSSEISKYYWDQHSEEYRSKLDGLLESSGLDREKVAGKKAIVAIPAMNEENLDNMLQVIKKSYGEGFEEDVTIIVYHNYKDPERVTQESKDALERSKALGQNIFVVEGQVPEHNNTGMAKKVVSDLALRVMGGELDIPLVMMDADVVGLTAQCIQDAVTKLKEPYVLAASPEFDYDPKLKELYPVLGLIWDLRRETEYLAKVKFPAENEHMTYGMFYAIDPRALAIVGGIKPLEQYEDSQLTQELKLYSLYNPFLNKEMGEVYEGMKHNPVYYMAPEGHTVYIDPSRELSALRKGELQFQRWRDKKLHQKSTSEGRQASLRNAQIVPDEEIPEFGEFNAENITAAINRADPYLMSVDNDGFAQMLNFKGRARISRFLYGLLKDRGIKIKDCDIIVPSSAKEINETIDNYENEAAFLEDHYEKPGWTFAKLKEVELV